MSEANCTHDLAIGKGSICVHCGKDLVFFKALTSLASANIGYPLLKLTEVLKEAKIPMAKLAEVLKTLELKTVEEVSQ
jgi:hypothetical protein